MKSLEKNAKCPAGDKFAAVMKPFVNEAKEVRVLGIYEEDRRGGQVVREGGGTTKSCNLRLTYLRIQVTSKLEKQCTKVAAEYGALLNSYGENPSKVKTEAFFGTVSSFFASLVRGKRTERECV